MADARMIAFGGGGPVHGYRVAEKLGVTPAGAVRRRRRIAIGFLRAPVAYEVVPVALPALRQLRPGGGERAARRDGGGSAGVVARGALGGAGAQERRLAFMRYVGQGHESRWRSRARDLDGGGRRGGARPLRRRIHPLLRSTGAGQRRRGDLLRRQRLDRGEAVEPVAAVQDAPAPPRSPPAPARARHGDRRGRGLGRLRPRGDRARRLRLRSSASWRRTRPARSLGPGGGAGWMGWATSN